jgi:hypothetical protein
MHPTPTPDRSEWSEARLDRLARAMFPLVFGRPAPAPEYCGGEVHQAVLMGDLLPTPPLCHSGGDRCDRCDWTGRLFDSQ